MMYDELIGNLRAKATHFHFNDETSLLLCKAADAIEELNKRCEEAYSNGLLEGGIAQRAEDEKWMPRWIPVTERLPEENGSYLIVDGGTVTQIVSEAYYDKRWGDSCWADPVEMYMTYHPTHWMSLPEPPKDGEE